EPVLLVGAAGHVIAENAALRGVLVVAGEQRDHGQALHGGGDVAPDHGGQPVGLALEGERAALHLLVMLELHREQADELQAHAGRAGDRDGRELVAAEDLLHVLLGDHVARRGSARPRSWSRGADRPARWMVRPGPTGRPRRRWPGSGAPSSRAAGPARSQPGSQRTTRSWEP